MVHNEFISCNVCDTKINLRSQMGYFDIHFKFRCPKCKTQISGTLKIAERENVGYDIKNACLSSLKKDITDSCCYSIELSAEFPTRKACYRNMSTFDETPFMRNMRFYDDDWEAFKFVGEAMHFANFIKTRWSEYLSNYELFWNNQYALLYDRLEKELAQYEDMPISRVVNELDAAMALYQLFVGTTGVSRILVPNALPEYTDISKIIVVEEVQNKEMIGYAKSLSPRLNEIERKGFKLIDLFSKVYEQLIPVVALRSANCIDNVDRDQYGIMTTNFEELTDFYAKSYEWILDNLNIIITLNNIVKRNDVNICHNNKEFEEVLSIGSKYKKIDFVGKSEPFSKPMESVRNRIRNAIQHFESEIDYESQEMIFIDNHRGNMRSEKLYLIDFASLCIDNFSIVIYILVLLYNIRRLLLMLSGIVPSCIGKEISNFEERTKGVKIGRNAPCICGSKNKYKRCCGK